MFGLRLRPLSATWDDQFSLRLSPLAICSSRGLGHCFVAPDGPSQSVHQKAHCWKEFRTEDGYTMVTQTQLRAGGGPNHQPAIGCKMDRRCREVQVQSHALQQKEDALLLQWPSGSAATRSAVLLDGCGWSSQANKIRNKVFILALFKLLFAVAHVFTIAVTLAAASYMDKNKQHVLPRASQTWTRSHLVVVTLSPAITVVGIWTRPLHAYLAYGATKMLSQSVCFSVLSGP